MPPRAWRSLPERELHERVAEVEGHESQVRGIVGHFYRMCQREVLTRIQGCADLKVLDIGCGEGMMFNGSGIRPVQLDVSVIRLQQARERAERLVCADAYELPFSDHSFQVVLLAHVLEHTRRPWQILRETYRVLQPGGQAVILIPNDLSLSFGRLLLLKFPIRYPDHLTFTTPRRLRQWLDARLDVVESFYLPFRALSFWLNLYEFVVARKRTG